jgi:tetratricopeptide (TPR) repeat protein
MPLAAIFTWMFSFEAFAQQAPPVNTGFRPFSKAGEDVSSTPAPNVPNVVGPEGRGDIMMARKMYREAIEAYREGPTDSAVVNNKIGIAYHQLLQLQLAKRYYERAVKLNPRYAEAINNLGTIEYTRKNYRRAIGLYKKALRYSPTAASMYVNLGTGYFARKDYKDATESFQKALSLDPEVFERRGSHGVLLQERSVEEKAKFHFYLSKMYAKAGDNEHALQYIRMCLEEGFKERKKFHEEPEFKGLQDLPAFRELMTLEPRVL